jgi:ATP synthase protein I
LINSQFKQTLGLNFLTLFGIGTGLSLAGLIISKDWATGFGFGVLISILPQSYFALQAFRVSAAKDPQRAYFATMRGASGKFLLTAALFVLLFKFLPDVLAPAVFCGFLVMLIMQIVGSALLVRDIKPAGKNQD